MSGSDGEKRPMIENAPPREDLARALASEPSPAPAEPKRKAFGVGIVLSMRDRDLLSGAAQQYIRQQEKGRRLKLRDHDHAERLRKLVGPEETTEYFAMLRDDLEERQRRWLADWRRYRAWRDWREGVIDGEALLKVIPGLDLEAPDLETKAPPKPPLVMPDYDPKENIGPERTFDFPPKLLAWVVDMLPEIDWPPVASKYAVETCAKFGIAPGEPKKDVLKPDQEGA